MDEAKYRDFLAVTGFLVDHLIDVANLALDVLPADGQSLQLPQLLAELLHEFALLSGQLAV